MKASVKLFTSDGETSQGFPVKLVVSHKGKTLRRTLGYSSLVYWDSLRGKPTPSHPDYESLYGQMLDIEKKALTAQFRNSTDVNLALNDLLDVPEARDITLKSYFKKQISLMRSQGRPGNADAYIAVMNQMEYYSPGLLLSDIEGVLLERFKRYKLKSCSDKTVKNYLGVLRALYNKALVDPDVNLTDKEPFKGVMTGLMVKRRRKKNRYLLLKDIQRLDALFHSNDLTRTEKRVVGLSLLQFYLGGLNLVDLYYLKRSAFYKDRILLSRKKLGRYAEEYDVKVFPVARAIFDFFEKDPTYIFPWRKDELGYKTFRRNHYRSLLALQQRHKIELHPVDVRLNINAFRHTFATLGKFAGVDPDIIRELMGHERNDIDTVYKDRYPESVRDASHGKIIGIGTGK